LIQEASELDACIHHPSSGTGNQGFRLEGINPLLQRPGDNRRHRRKLTPEPLAGITVIGFASLEPDPIDLRISPHLYWGLIHKMALHAFIESVRKPPVAGLRGWTKTGIAKPPQQLR